MNYVMVENEKEFKVFPREHLHHRVVDDREIFIFIKPMFTTANQVRVYAREYLSIEGIMEIKRNENKPL